MAVITKFAETFMMLTLVVDSARVSADVKSAHIRALKRRFRPKKVPRRATLMNVFSRERPRRVAIEAERVEVRAVVVLFAI